MGMASRAKQVNYLVDTYAYMDQDPNIRGGYNTPRDPGQL